MQKQTNWSISEFYEKSWELTKENKKLWIIGLLATIFGSSQSSNSNIDLPEFNQTQEETSSEDPFEPIANQQLNKVESVAQTTQPYLEQIKAGWQNTSLNTKFIFGTEIVAILIFGTIIGFIVGAWVRATLMHGVRQAAEGKLDSLVDVVKTASKDIKTFIALTTLPGFVLLAAMLATALGFVILAGIINALNINPPSIVNVVVVIGLVVAFFYAIIRYSIGLIWSFWYRVHSEHQLGWWDALKAGWRKSNGTIWKTIKLGLANMITSMVFFLVVFLPTVLIGARNLFEMFGTQEGVNFNPTAWIVFGTTFLLNSILAKAASALWSVFITSTWEFAFQSVTADDNAKKENL